MTRPTAGRRPARRGARAAGVLLTAVAATGLVAGSALTATASARPAPSVPAGTAPTGVGETASSANMRLVDNTPKSGAFADAGAYNSDLAFTEDGYAYAGNYNGFSVYDLDKPQKPELVAQVTCNGPQNDVTVYDDILVLSTDSRRTDDTCTSAASSDLTNYWEGVKVFDISDRENPEYVASVETACGSHTHTNVPDPENGSLLVYVSSYSPNAQLAKCQPPHDQISVVDIPLDAPADASLLSEEVLFPDGGYPGGVFPGTPPANRSATSGCHDITVFPELDLAAGACMGDGVLMDISDPRKPVVTDSVQDVNFAFWHSATFNNDGTKVIFTDELGGGGAATCTAAIGPTRGANGIYDVVDGELQFASYYKIPRHNAATENCVAHNGSLIPVPGRDVMVQAWYQGGVSVFDFTDSANPREIAWFDRGPLSTSQLVLGGSWSAYWHDGYVYSNDIQQGFDVFSLRGTAFTEARKVELGEHNPQTQQTYPVRRG
ncbi:hypothetical protein [Pseudokineococcus lusitanus]|uniref:LVIVD repeat-containing protein n=1 Tax=Pseudokineococcus lusitanus TaxID=763993 RepID=UPI000F471EC2